jgi:hypothetical protein
MAFNEKIVFGLCNILNRYELPSKVKPDALDIDSMAVEHLARKMDLNFRDIRDNWKFMVKNPTSITNNLTEIETLFLNLLSELYKVENSVQRELSRDLNNITFSKLRIELREKYDSLKKPILNMKETINNGARDKINLNSLAAVEVATEVWVSSDILNDLPETIERGTRFYNFVNDCLEAFDTKDEVTLAYENWYKVTQKPL